MDKSDGQKQVQATDDIINEKNVETAIKFLENSNVRKTSFSSRIAFLKRKGLSDKEIDIAVERSGTKADKDLNKSEESQRFFERENGMQNTPSQVAVSAPSTLQRLSGFASSAIIGGGIIYATHFVIQKYVMPYFVEKETDAVKALDKAIRELNNGIQELSSVVKNSLENQEATFESQKDLLSKIHTEFEGIKAKLDLLPSDITSLSDVKAELTSIKGLFLGRQVFPSTRFTASSTSPSIPAWQKASTKKSLTETKLPKDQEKDATDHNPEFPLPDKDASILLSESIDCHEELKNDDSVIFDDVIGDDANLTRNDSSSVSSTDLKVNHDS